MARQPSYLRPQVNNLYQAFTPQEHNPKSKYDARIMSDGIIAIRKSGTREALLQKNTA